MRNVFILSCAAALACAAVAPGQQPDQPGRGTRAVARFATRWEYDVHSDDDLTKLGGGDLKSGLNKLGADGWELVAVGPGAGSGQRLPHDLRYYFKRAAVPPGGAFGFAGGGAPGAAVMTFGTGRVVTWEPAADEPPHVIRLKYARGPELLEILNYLYRQTPGTRLAADPRTNSLIVVAPEKQLGGIMQLVKELDVEGSERSK
jgi:hypothetical protein